MHLQAKLSTTAPTCAKSTRSQSQLSAPPGSVTPWKPRATQKKDGAVRLSLSELCGSEEKNAILPPPGLSLDSVDKPMVLDGKVIAPPPGLSLLSEEQGIESDDTSAGGPSSSETEDSGQSDGEQSSPGLVLAEVSQLRTESPLFQPLLTPGAAAILFPHAAAGKPLRTKLRSKANVYVPAADAAEAALDTGALPFVPMASVNEAWQTWQMQNSMYGELDGYSSYDGNAGYFSKHDGISSYESMTDFYPEQEWTYEI